MEIKLENDVFLAILPTAAPTESLIPFYKIGSFFKFYKLRFSIINYHSLTDWNHNSSLNRLNCKQSK